MKQFYVLLLFICFCSSITAQKFSFIQYNTSKGLPQSQVNTITQDESGYIWVGTFGGLARFDGQNFTNYGKNNGLLNNRITKLEVIDGRLFIGHQQGISIKNADNSFTSIPNRQDTVLNDVSGFSTLDSTIYISTNGGGLYILNLEKKSIEKIENSPARIRNIIKYKDKLFLATRTGLHQFDGVNFKVIENSKQTSFSGIKIKGNKIYASSFSGALFEVDVNKSEIKEILYSDFHMFRNVTIDHKNNFWLSSRNGILLVKENDTIDITEASGLPTEDIYEIFEDSEENIWIGTNGKGIIRFTDEVFTYYNESSGLPSDLIIALEMDKYKNKWISTLDQGVFKIDPKGNISKIDFINSGVWQIVCLNEIVLFASNFGLHVYDYKQFKSYYKEEDDLPSNRVKGIHPLNDSIFLVSTNEGSILFNSITRQIYKGYSSLDEIKGVRDFETKNELLYAASPNGIYTITKDFVVEKDYFDSGINSIALDHLGNLWIGTENGLYIKKDGKYKRQILEKEENLEFVNFIQRYDTLMFIGTNNGLYEVGSNLKHNYHYGITSGLIDLETNLNSNYLEKNRFLWFGTASGLMKMDLENRSSLMKNAKPKLHLTRITINNKELNDKNVEIYNTDHDTKTLTMKFTDKNISFNFDGIYMTNPGSLRYSYFLEGFSTDWSPPNNNSNASFTNLPPGEYLFKFRVDNGSYATSDIFSLPIEVTPPFYRTWWFYLIVAIIVLLLIFTIDKARHKKLESNNYKVKLEFQNKLSKLEQQSLNASMNRHFIFNALNSIQYYINVADTKSANKYLSRFAKLIRKNLDSSYHKDGMVALSDEIDRLKLYLDLESMRFIDRFTYSINVDHEVEAEVLKVPAMFLQPFVENSIIHGILPMKDRMGEIVINVKEHLDHIRIEIKDNGIGIEDSLANKNPDSSNHQSQGMMIAKGRIELLQKISARSIEMVGPLQIKENDTLVNGTIVTFKIMKQYLE
ncbi:sensor histidine kinase [Brumimicrobium mesophilum]|uniref:sensor histidine kinase n=1 Tax=Brumimicrobium mesophilum TaxID=392717 RepID=UPI000D141086|nr:sensor histidine kinase [Brumimicrobium mesophilum]